jgi:hypothetical protein
MKCLRIFLVWAVLCGDAFGATDRDAHEEISNGHILQHMTAITTFCTFFRVVIGTAMVCYQQTDLRKESHNEEEAIKKSVIVTVPGGLGFLFTTIGTVAYYYGRPPWAISIFYGIAALLFVAEAYASAKALPANPGILLMTFDIVSVVAIVGSTVVLGVQAFIASQAASQALRRRWELDDPLDG